MNSCVPIWVTSSCSTSDTRRVNLVTNAPAHGVYVFQLIQYFRACVLYKDFLDRGLLLTRKLLIQRFLVVTLKSSPLRTFYGHYHDLDAHSQKILKPNNFNVFWNKTSKGLSGIAKLAKLVRGKTTITHCWNSSNLSNWLLVPFILFMLYTIACKKCTSTCFIVMSLIAFPVFSVAVAWFSWPHLIGTEVTNI
jgi:hypothetical protein